MDVTHKSKARVIIYQDSYHRKGPTLTSTLKLRLKESHKLLYGVWYKQDIF